MPLRILKAAAALAALLGSTMAFAWGDVGHMTVCQIAYDSATPATRTALGKLISGRDFARQCIWPDQVKKVAQVPRGQKADPKKVDWAATAGYHFINYEDGEHWASANPASFAQGGDMLQEIMIAKRALADSSLAKERRLCHLRFLGHLAGDAHQPLHVGRAVDRGGNLVSAPLMGLAKYKFKAAQLVDGRETSCFDQGDVNIQPGCFVKKEIDPNVPDPIIREVGECGGCVNVVTFVEIPTSAHGLWDDGFIELRLKQLVMDKEIQLPASNEQADSPFSVFPVYAEFLERKVKQDARRARLWMWDDVMRWAEGSAALRPFAYDMKSVPRGPVPADVTQIDEITEDRAAASKSDPFFQSRIKVVEDQILRAGYHLAGQLNRLFDPAFRDESIKEFGEPEVAAREAAGQARNQEIEARIALRRSGAFVSQCDLL